MQAQLIYLQLNLTFVMKMGGWISYHKNDVKNIKSIQD